MANYSIQAGLGRLGYHQYESELLPKNSIGMIFIGAKDGRHIATLHKEVLGECITPINKEYPKLLPCTYRVPWQ